MLRLFKGCRPPENCCHAETRSFAFRWIWYNSL